MIHRLHKPLTCSLQLQLVLSTIIKMLLALQHGSTTAQCFSLACMRPVFNYVNQKKGHLQHHCQLQLVVIEHLANTAINLKKVLLDNWTSFKRPPVEQSFFSLYQTFCRMYVVVHQGLVYCCFRGPKNTALLMQFQVTKMNNAIFQL